MLLKILNNNNLDTSILICFVLTMTLVPSVWLIQLIKNRSNIY